MSNIETELPFANPLADITTEILAEVSELTFGATQQDVARMTTRLTELHAIRNRRERVERVLEDADNYQTEVVAQVLTNTQLFRNWPAGDKRYFLHRALDIDIIYEESRITERKTDALYGGPTNSEAITAYTTNITRRKNLQAKLSQRATPSSPQARK